MNSYHKSAVTIVGNPRMSGGLASDHGDHETGHVTLYTDDGSLTLGADTPEALEKIAGAMFNAAALLRRMQINKEALGRLNEDVAA